MLGELEDAHQTNDAQERQRRARLGAGAAHRRHDVDERDVVRHDCRQVDEVLEVAPEEQFVGTGDEADEQLEREPHRARRLDDEERVPKQFALHQQMFKLVANCRSKNATVFQFWKSTNTYRAI